MGSQRDRFRLVALAPLAVAVDQGQPVLHLLPQWWVRLNYASHTEIRILPHRDGNANAETEFLSDKTYRDKLDVILRRIKRSDAGLRKSFLSIASTGYKADYDHCVDVINRFVSKINLGL